MTEIVPEVLAGPAVVASPPIPSSKREQQLRRRLAPLTWAAFVAGLIWWLIQASLQMIETLGWFSPTRASSRRSLRRRRS